MFGSGDSVEASADTYAYQSITVAEEVISLTGTETEPDTMVSGSAGNGAAHNNLPPYIVLRICKKTVDSLVATET